MKNSLNEATAFAPATVANVAVGFDLFGFPMDLVGDTVTVVRTKKLGVTVKMANPSDLNSDLADGAPELPTDPEKNTATVGLLELIQDYGLNFGFNVTVQKGIPIGSGMGGSAASAVAAVVAANALLDRPLPIDLLLKYALSGESVASGSMHPDNVAPCLYGGLVFTQSVEDPVRVVKIPVPNEILCVLVHPHLRVETKTARAILRREVPLIDHVKQSRNLAGFLAGCYQGDLEILGASLEDLIIEPQRAHLIPGFYAAKKAALSEGAMGFSISGSGPSVFAWAKTKAAAEKIRYSVVAAFKKERVECDSWIAPISSGGASLIK